MDSIKFYNISRPYSSALISITTSWYVSLSNLIFECGPKEDCSALFECFGLRGELALSNITAIGDINKEVDAPVISLSGEFFLTIS